MRSARLPVKQLRAIQVGGVIELKIRVAQCLEFRAQRVRHHPLSPWSRMTAISRPQRSTRILM